MPLFSPGAWSHNVYNKSNGWLYKCLREPMPELNFPKCALSFLTKPNTLFRGSVFMQEEYLPICSESLANLPIQQHTQAPGLELKSNSEIKPSKKPWPLCPADGTWKNMPSSPYPLHGLLSSISKRKPWMWKHYLGKFFIIDEWNSTFLVERETENSVIRVIKIHIRICFSIYLHCFKHISYTSALCIKQVNITI